MFQKKLHRIRHHHHQHHQLIPSNTRVTLLYTLAAQLKFEQGFTLQSWIVKSSAFSFFPIFHYFSSNSPYFCPHLGLWIGNSLIQEGAGYATAFKTTFSRPWCYLYSKQTNNHLSCLYSSENFYATFYYDNKIGISTIFKKVQKFYRKLSAVNNRVKSMVMYYKLGSS